MHSPFDTEDLIRIIMDAAITVKRTLGEGFLEAVYQNALIYELQAHGLTCEKEKNLTVYYRGQVAGYYREDIIVENRVILEIKVCEEIARSHEYQLVNYLRATNIEDGLIINFGSFPLGFKRKFLHKK